LRKIRTPHGKEKIVCKGKKKVILREKVRRHNNNRKRSCRWSGMTVRGATDNIAGRKEGTSKKGINKQVVNWDEGRMYDRKETLGNGRLRSQWECQPTLCMFRGKAGAGGKPFNEEFRGERQEREPQKGIEEPETFRESGGWGKAQEIHGLRGNCQKT